MAIRVEFIRRRPGGRITVRPTIYDKDNVTFGRATDCDVHLPDLRVGLHHARLICRTPEKARIEASTDYRVRVDGALIRRRDLSIDQDADVRIGPYKITLGPADADADLLIEIELVEAPTAVGESGDEDEIFSMKGYAPDKRISAWAVTVLVFTVFLAIPLIVYLDESGEPRQQRSTIDYLSPIANQNWLSGALSSAHANLGANCRVCHEQTFVRVRDDVCLSCHSQTRNHAPAQSLVAAAPDKTTRERWLSSLHNQLNIPEERCGSCHFEHNGANGITPTSSSMCVECHSSMDRRFDETTLVNVINFSHWHPEFKPRIILDPQPDILSVKRISLVEHPKENNGLKFPHDFHLKDKEVIRKLATLGPVSQARYGDKLDCADCHQVDAAGAFITPIEMELHCGDCHSLAFVTEQNANVRFLPHGDPEDVRATLEDFYLAKATELLLGDRPSGVLERQLSAEARARRAQSQSSAFVDARTNTQNMIARIFSKDGICQKCHTTIDSGANSGMPRMQPVKLTNRYLPKAQFSHAQHMAGNTDCVDCHRAETSSHSSDVLMPSITVCRTCHNDTSGTKAIASDCLTCHSYHDDSNNAPLMTSTNAVVKFSDGAK